MVQLPHPFDAWHFGDLQVQYVECTVTMYNVCHCYVECCVTSVVPYMQDLPKLKSLDLSYNEIAIVCDLHTKIGNLSKLILAFNKIATLKGNRLHVDI